MNPLIEKYKEESRWVNYRLVEKEGKLTKIPYQINGYKASSTDPSTWDVFDKVKSSSDMVGIVFTDSQLLLGIDVDHCMVDGKICHELKEQIAELILESDTYTEISVSGTGLHLFLSLTAPLVLNSNKCAPYEAYTRARYFTVSGQHFGEPKEVRVVSPEEALRILAIIGYPWKKNKVEVATSQGLSAPSLDDKTILEKMFSSNHGEKIRTIYNGDVTAYEGDDSSADLAMCSHLAFWTGKNAAQIERIWTASPLGSREKTQKRRDYRARTIETAITGCSQVYQNDDVSIVGPIEIIENKLKDIPSDLPKTRITEALSPIFQQLITIDKITAESFLLYNVKEYFGMTKSEAQKYISRLNSLRSQAIKKRREQKKENYLPLIIDRDIDFQEVYDAVSEIGIVDKKTLCIVVAVVISAKLRLNPPLWLLLIGVPSSFKTELVGLCGAMSEVFTLDSLTENAFASGYMPPDGSEPQDLLPLLDNKCFIVKDLNTIFSMNEELVKKVLGDLTSIFDGKFEKFTATRGMISYNSLFSMLGCITPSILIKHYNYVTQLGPRFFFLRIPELTDEERQTGFNKSWNETKRKEKIIKARQTVSSYCTQLTNKIKQNEGNAESEEIREKINNIALFIANARGIAISTKTSFKDSSGKDVNYYEINDWQVEQPWRVLNQLKSLLRVISFINKKDIVGDDEIETIKPIVLSTMPVDRAEILNILITECGLSAKQLSKRVGKSTKTIRRTMKELEALKITDSYRDPKNASGQAPWLYFISPKFAYTLNAPIPSPECLSQSKGNIEDEASKLDEELDKW